MKAILVTLFADYVVTRVRVNNIIEAHGWYGIGKLYWHRAGLAYMVEMRMYLWISLRLIRMPPTNAANAR
jgi:hypothetical protein